MSIVVAGAGAFGTALAISLAGPEPVTLLGRNPDEAKAMAKTRINARRLPKATLPASLEVTADPDCLLAADIVLLCIPAQRLGAWLDAHTDVLTGKALIACCKGLDLSTLKGPADTILDRIPSATAGVLTGPSFAVEIAQGLPTALTLACADEVRSEVLQQALSRENLRIYRSQDVTGATLGGALKNVIAIGAGICIGAGLGESARAALITRGFSEMQKIATVLGAQSDTLMGLSGFGDLILTCSSEKSRNYSYGLALGRSTDFDRSITVEGAATAQAATRLAEAHGLDMPLTRAINDLVRGTQTVEETLRALLARPLKEE